MLNSKEEQKRSIHLMQKSKVSAKETVILTLQRSKSQPNQNIAIDHSLNRFLLSQKGNRIISPYQKIERESLGNYNLNLLSLRGLPSDSQSLGLSRLNIPTPLPKRRIGINTACQTSRSDLIISVTQNCKNEFLKDLNRNITPSKNQFTSLNKSARILNSNTSRNNIEQMQQESMLFQNRIQNEKDQIANNKFGFNRISNATAKSNNNNNKSFTSIQAKDKDNNQSFGQNPTNNELNVQIQSKIDEFSDINYQISLHQQEKMDLSTYIEQIKKEIGREKQQIQKIGYNHTKFSRDAQQKGYSNKKLGTESIFRSLEIQKTFKEVKNLQEELSQVKGFDEELQQQIDQEKLLIERLKGDIYQKKKEYLDDIKNKEQLIKEFNQSHKYMMSTEKIYLDQTNISNLRIHQVSQSTTQSDGANKSEMITSRNGFTSFNQLHDEGGDQYCSPKNFSASTPIKKTSRTFPKIASSQILLSSGALH